MPHCIKSLADVQKCSRTVLIAVQCVVNDVDYTVNMLSSSVFLPETKLMIR